MVIMMVGLRKLILLVLDVDGAQSIKELEEKLKRMCEELGKGFSIAQLYARLSELRRDGLIEKEGDRYCITELGEEKLYSWISEGEAYED